MNFKHNERPSGGSVLAALAALVGCSGFNLSNTLGSNMILQRAPGRAVLFGFAEPTEVVTTYIGGMPGGTYQAKTGADGVWRQQLPPQSASFEPITIRFTSSSGRTATLENVLFGDVIFCSGQSNSKLNLVIIICSCSSTQMHCLFV